MASDLCERDGIVEEAERLLRLSELKHLVDTVLDDMTIDEIKQLVAEMEAGLAKPN